MKWLIHFLFLITPYYLFSQVDYEEEKWYYGKKLAAGFESEIITVLKKYPDLEKIRIRFIYKDLKNSLMMAQPTWSFWLKSKKNRKYKIFINLHPQPDVNLADFPKEVILGIFAHELAHIQYFHQRNSILLGIDFLRYGINCPFKIRFEKKTDEIAIQHGWGKELKAAWEFTSTSAPIPEKLKIMKKFYYLKPEEIQKLIQKQKLQHGDIQSNTFSN